MNSTALTGWIAMSICNSLRSILAGVLFVPTLDTIRVMLLRFTRGVSMFKPDRNHIHHILVDFGFSHRRASFCIGFINFLVAFIMFYVTQKLTIIQSLMILISMFFIAFTVLFLNFFCGLNGFKHLNSDMLLFLYNC